MKCPNCGSKLSCGCQKRTSSGGKQCCSKCIGICDKASVPTPTPTPQPNNNLAPVIHNVNITR